MNPIVRNILAVMLAIIDRSWPAFISTTPRTTVLLTVRSSTCGEFVSSSSEQEEKKSKLAASEQLIIDFEKFIF
ncbi:MAG: 3-dehydroquinate dehydratase [Oceanospirillaceae bacterium]|jgi:3-dehydroquinate dehydratase